MSIQERTTTSLEKTEIPSSESSTEAVDLNSLETHPSSESAVNPETGEINWDCPCLGNLAKGPCGE
jgi:intermembrane space import and assembly protein 40